MPSRDLFATHPKFSARDHPREKPLNPGQRRKKGARGDREEHSDRSGDKKARERENKRETKKERKEALISAFFATAFRYFHPNPRKDSMQARNPSFAQACKTVLAAKADSSSTRIFPFPCFGTKTPPTRLEWGETPCGNEIARQPEKIPRMPTGSPAH